MHAIVRRGLLATAAATAGLALTVGTASAHHCYVPMYSLQGPVSPNWIVISAEMGAAEIAGVTLCEGGADAGYAALKAAGLPVGIKIFDKMTIGDPKGDEENFRIPTRQGANGKGLEYFGAGSTLADEMLETFIPAGLEYCAMQE